jgi:hypothetical protein
VALAAGCVAHSFTQKEEAVCTPSQTRTRNCCNYTDCRSDPALPDPVGPCLAIDAAVPGSYKRVFTTSQVFSAPQLNGLDGADKICLDAATSAGLGGAWKAWLSDDKTNAIDRIADVGPWRLTDKQTTLAFADKTSLTNPPQASLYWDEKGESVFAAYPPGQPVYSEVWTGTRDSGKSGDNNCSNWTESQGFGDVGFIDSRVYWTSIGYPRNCFATNHLYCFEQ